MREILFRGQSIYRREWYEGDLYQSRLKSVFYINYYTEHGDRMAVEVDPETVGQYTGLTDKNGVKIFEGDIMPVWENGEEYHYKVIYDGDCFMLSMIDSEQGSYPLSVKNSISEIIGNIYDNPELLKGGTE